MLPGRASLLANFARVVVLAALFAAPHLFALQFSSELGTPSIRYHFGDDAGGDKGWDSPNFDDRSWPVASQNQWPRPPFYSDGFVWVRFSVPVRTDTAEPLALRVNTPNGVLLAYEVYVNGARVGSLGRVPPGQLVESLPRDAIFDLSPGLTRPGTIANVTFRIWYPPFARRADESDSLNLTFDQSRTLHVEDVATRQRALLRNLLPMVFNGFILLIGFTVLMLGRSSHSRELLLYGAMLSSFPWLTLFFEIVDARLVTLSAPEQFALQVVSQLPAMIITVEFIWRINELKDVWFKRLTYAVMILFNLGILVAFIPAAPSPLVAGGQVGYLIGLETFDLLTLAANLWVIVVKRSKRLIALAMILVPIASLVSGFRSSYRGGANLIDLAFFLAGLCLSAVLAQQAWKEWRARDALKAEFEAARQVQQVLVPAEDPAIPGFRIDCLYLPAGQVGGDFYQIIRTASSGALIVIGDVSGKGMPAAMTVSLLVGTFRTLVHYTQSPGEILDAMNARMLARSKGGFTTCLVLHIDPDGTLTAANAGHLAPYMDGKELKLENGLPLGLAAEAQYVESSLQLQPSSRLTLVTDGVVEARNAHGELFGFERTASIATQPADLIASAAHLFGQEDDITVITLRFAPAEVVHA